MLAVGIHLKIDGTCWDGWEFNKKPPTGTFIKGLTGNGFQDEVNKIELQFIQG